MLDKKGNLYADRPELPMANMSGWDRALSQLHYNQRFKDYRKLISRVVGTRKSMERFYPAEEHQSSMLLKRILSHPKKIEEACRKTAGAVVLQIAYGYRVKEDGIDPLVDLADKSLAQFSDLTTPGKWIVDLLPSMRHLPRWFPFVTFHKVAEEFTKGCDDLAEVPYNFVKQQMDQGIDEPSYVSDLLKSEEISDEHLFNIKWSAASFYGGGSDTTVSIIYAYFLACCLHPEFQTKIQAEIDSVIGRDRLPSYDDRESLPYVEAVCKELFRWIPIVPLAVPHRAVEDDIHDGYLIPKGTLVIANVWKFLHDANLYKDPFAFNPDRFMGPNPERDPTDFCFGFGRRVCPGLHLADASVWINVVKAAAAFDITKALDAQGRPIPVFAESTDGVITRPLPFDCDVKPRHEKVIQMVELATIAGAH